jgi:hypothetical protein
MTATSPFPVAAPDSCRNLLHHSEGKENVTRFINIYIFSLH